jgi:hypothetical protein
MAMTHVLSDIVQTVVVVGSLVSGGAVGYRHQFAESAQGVGAEPLSRHRIRQHFERQHV